MAWLTLIIAGLLEVVWSTAMKQSDGFSCFWPSVAAILFMLLSFTLLALAMKTLPLGTAYAVWVGIGAVGAFAAGILMMGDPVSFLRLLAAAMIVGGVVLMKVAH